MGLTAVPPSYSGYCCSDPTSVPAFDKRGQEDYRSHFLSSPVVYFIERNEEDVHLVALPSPAAAFIASRGFHRRNTLPRNIALKSLS